MKIKEVILEQLNKDGSSWITARSLCKKLGFSFKSDESLLLGILIEMEKDGSVISYNGKYVLPEKSGFLSGSVKRHERGYAFFIPDSGDKDLFIPPKYLNGALQGDKVLVEKVLSKSEKNDECAVVKILKRGVNQLIGIYSSEKCYGFVCPDDASFGADIFIKKGNSGGAKTGQKVVCEIIGYPYGENPTGKITAILGNPFSFETQVKSILIENEVEKEFPTSVMRECYDIKEEISQEEFKNRQDFTDLLTVTIDGEDARDFDDAISVESKNGETVLYVHIADVSAYVKSGSAIDAEAFKRGTSIYMPECVIPMLPEKLCNGICSLNPDVKRLAVTVKMHFDENGVLTDKSFYKSIIKSNYRMTYSEVQEIFNGNQTLIKKYNKVYRMLLTARALKDKILLLRDEKGSVDLDVSETKISVDSGRISVDVRNNLESERLIEQFMISANVAVAEFIFYSEMPGIYRVHETPNQEKSESFLNFLNALGIRHGKRKIQYPKDFQQILKQVEGNALSPVINSVMLKSMQKAEYSSQNLGHFGLNETCYCHFTSPIRRYPDLVMHRILKGILDGDGLKISDDYAEKVAEIANECSLKERRATSVERSVDDVYVCKFMSNFVGDLFEGIVSGVNSFGIFIRLENSVEGLIPLENLPKGKYDFDANLFTLKSAKRSFSLGNKLLVKLVSANIQSGKISFAYIGKL